MISAESKEQAIEIILELNKPTGNRSRGQRVLDHARAIIAYLEGK